MVHDEKSAAVGSHACVMTDSDAHTDRVNPRNGGHSNRNPIVVKAKTVSVFRVKPFGYIEVYMLMHLRYSRRVGLKINC